MSLYSFLELQIRIFDIITMKTKTIAYIFFFILLFVNSLYVYGASAVRIAIIFIMLIFSIIRGIYLPSIYWKLCLLFIYATLIGLIFNPDTCVEESKITISLFFYSIIIRQKWDIYVIIKFLWVISYFVNLYITAFIICGIIGFPLTYDFLPETNVVIHNDIIGFSSSTLQALSFFIVFNGILFINYKSILSAFPFFLSIINVIFSQRRALLLFPFILLIYYLFKNLKKRYIVTFFFATIFAVSCILSFILPTFSDMTVTEYFSFTMDLLQYDEDSDGIRFEQFEHLLGLFLSNPIVGHGIGAYDHTYIRDETARYSYELSLFALLIKLGLPCFIYLFVNYIKAINHKIRNMPSSVPIVLGSLCIFLSNITNPYINVSLILLLILPFANFYQKSISK